MSRRILVPAFVAGIALALTGCTPKYPKCNNDDQCKEHGEVCINGSCQECGKDGDCKAGFVCKATKCVPKPECGADADCQAGFKCKAEKCVPECTADADCGPKMKCNAGRCAPGAECVSNADCTGGKICDENQKCVEAPQACGLETVFFGFNEFSLTSDSQRALDRVAECIKSRQSSAVTLAGHADERGTEEYNLHLGEKRANAVKKYLSALGVDAAKLKTISYGEERPASPGHDEGAWTKNRRVEFAD